MTASCKLIELRFDTPLLALGETTPPLKHADARKCCQGQWIRETYMMHKSIENANPPAGTGFAERPALRKKSQDAEMLAGARDARIQKNNA